MALGKYIRTLEHNKHISEAKKGKRRSEETKHKISETRKMLFKEGKLNVWRHPGLTYEELQGVEKAKERKEKLRKRLQGKTWEELYGEDKAREMRNDPKRKLMYQNIERNRKISESKKGHKVSNEMKERFSKIHRGKQRDLVVNEELRKQGYLILRYWEHEIKDNVDGWMK